MITLSLIIVVTIAGKSFVLKPERVILTGSQQSKYQSPSVVNARIFLSTIPKDRYVHMNCSLAQGIYLPGHSTTHLLMDISKIDFSGKNVLDIGPTDGCATFEMEKRGALNVFAVDIYAEKNFLFSDLHNLYNSRSNFVKGSVYELGALFQAEFFDYIHFAGVFYHLRHPLLAVDAIWHVLKIGGGVVIETASLPRKNRHSGQEGRFSIGYHPYDSLNNDPTNQFEHTPMALKATFESSGFECTEVDWRGDQRSTAYCIKVAQRYFVQHGYHIHVDSIDMESIKPSIRVT